MAIHARATRRAILVVGAMLCAGFTVAQTTPDQLESALKGKRFVLRNFSADQTVKAKWVNDALMFDPPALSTFGVFAPGSVKLNGTTLTIAGTRFVVLLDGKTGKPGISDGSPTWLQIDLGSADPAVVIPKLQSALFFPDIDSAANEIPVQFGDLVPYRLNPSDASKSSAALNDRDIWYLDGNVWKSLPHDSKNATPPKLIHSGNPLYPAQARQLRVQGSVFLAVIISKTGHVESPWLLKPSGYGMDESAATALLQSSYAPAQVDGQPVAEAVRYVTNFHIGME